MKFAFVCPRYGAEISVGAEHACRLLAEGIGSRHDVDVLTTCAHDPLTWKNQYAEGADRIRGVVVRRFAVTQPHDHISFQQLSHRLFSGHGLALQDELEWLARKGPWSPGLLDHIKRHHASYDALVFFSLLEPTTFHGASIAPGRTVLVPYLTLHPALRFGIWPGLAASVGGLGLMSGAELPFARAFLGPDLPFTEVVGVGVDASPQDGYPRHQQDPADDPAHDDLESTSEDPVETTHLSGRGVPFRRRYRLYAPFVVYGDRVDSANGSEEMLEYFDAYAAAASDASELLLTGVKFMKLPGLKGVRMAGVLPERERRAAFEAADVTLAPNPDDLLAMSTLQSFAVGTPVLASAANAAAVDHCRRANAGLYYANRDEFVGALQTLTGSATLRERLGDNGRRYVQQQHRWDAVINRFERLANRTKTRH